MKKLGQFCALVILILTITLTSYAGHIDCPGITQEPPTEETTSETQSEAESDGTITEALLILLEGVFLVV